MNTQIDLTVIPFKHHYWHVWSLHAAHAFVWVGFWIAALRTDFLIGTAGISVA